MDDRRARLSNWFYLLGIAGYTVADAFLQTWLTIFYVPSPDRGLPLIEPQLFGFAFLVARVLEAVANPLIGFTAERSGRVSLFLIGGGLTFGLVGTALFFVPQSGQTAWNTILLFALLPLMTLGQACFIVPYLGLIPRVASSPEQQVRLTNTQALLILVAVLCGQVLSGAALQYLQGSLQTAALLFVGLAVVLMVLSGLSVRSLSGEVPPGFAFREMGAILGRNRGFRILVLALFLFWLGFSMVRSAATYFVTVLLGEPKEATALFLGILFVTTLASVVGSRFIAPRAGKRRMMIGANVLFAAILPLLATVGLAVGPLTPRLWAMVVFAALGLPLGILSAIQNPLVAEQAALDARLTGQAKGALFFGVQGLLIKVSYGLAAALLGFLQANFGYTAAQPLGIRLIGPIAGVLALAAAGMYVLYPENLEEKI